MDRTSRGADAGPCFLLHRFPLLLRPCLFIQWRRQNFVTGGSEVWVYRRSIEYVFPQSRLYCLCINVALCSTALQCICRVIRRSSMTMKAHTYYIIFGRPPPGGATVSIPFSAPLFLSLKSSSPYCPVKKMTASYISLRGPNTVGPTISKVGGDGPISGGCAYSSILCSVSYAKWPSES